MAVKKEKLHSIIRPKFDMICAHKKAMSFSIDAFIAVSLIIVSILIIPYFSSSKPEDMQLRYTSQDLARILSKTRLHEIQNQYIDSLVSSGYIKNLNNTIFEQLGELWVNEEREKASNLIKNLTTGIIPPDNGFSIAMDNNVIYQINKTPIKSLISSKKLVTGLQEKKPIMGWTARLWLTGIKSKNTITIVMGDAVCGGFQQYSWGWYCGWNIKNTINYSVQLPPDAAIQDAFWFIEPSWVGQTVTAYLNGNKVFGPSSAGYGITVPYASLSPYLISGNNTATLVGNEGGDDGASHFVVKYRTSEIQTLSFSQKDYFETVTAKAALHYEKAIFSPYPIENIYIRLNVSNTTRLSFMAGGSTFNIGAKTPVKNLVEFTDNEIKAALSANGISYAELSDQYVYFILNIGEGYTGETSLKQNSYAQIIFEEPEPIYNSIDITKEIPVDSYSNQVTGDFYRYVKWKFFIPVNATPLFAKWQLGWYSYSGDASQEAKANNITLFKHPPDEYIQSFARFGYTPNRAQGALTDDTNTFELTFAPGYSVSTTASYGITTFLIEGGVGYGRPFAKYQGSSNEVEFEDGAKTTFNLGNTSDGWDPDRDALDDALQRLLDKLDFDKDSKPDIIIEDPGLSLDSYAIPNVPYLWGPAIMEVRVWQ